MEILLPYRPPLDWEALIAFLGARAIPGVESAEGHEYRRTVRLGSSRGVIEVRPRPRGSALEARIHGIPSRHARELERRLRRLFDLDADPRALDRVFGPDRVLRSRFAKLAGVRVPGAWDGFELAVRAILGQQVSVRGARTLAGRVVDRCGDSLPEAMVDGPTRTFPTPRALAAADLSALGLTGGRVRAIGSLAGAVAAGALSLEGEASPERLDALRALPGIGDWTAQYVAMRALGDRDAFPAGDLGVRRALASGGELPPVREVERIAEAWRPFRAYAVMLLWLA